MLTALQFLVLLHYIFGSRTQKKPGPFDWMHFHIIVVHNKYGDSDDHQLKEENRRERSKRNGLDP